VSVYKLQLITLPFIPSPQGRGIKVFLRPLGERGRERGIFRTMASFLEFANLYTDSN